MNRESQMKEFDKFVERQRTLLFSKGSDYASSADVLSNFKLTGSILGQTAVESVTQLIATKVVRLGNLIANKAKPNNESIADTLIDLSNYAFLANCILQEMQEAKHLHNDVQSRPQSVFEKVIDNQSASMILLEKRLNAGMMP